jgi:hypothetical protein
VIPATTGGRAPITSGNITFHVVVDNVNRTSSMDGPDGLKFWEFDARAIS